MKKILMIFIALAVTAGASAQKRTVTRDYTYRASDVDSKVTSRTNATTEMRNILLREVGEFLKSEQTLIRQSVMKNGKEELTEDFSKKVEAITAGIVEMKVLDEQWNGETYYIKAEMTVDTKEVGKRIAEIMSDKQKTKELEDARKRVLALEAEVKKWQQEAARNKTAAAKQAYQKQAENLDAEEYYTRASNAVESGFNELAIEYYQKAIDISPRYAEAYDGLGNAYRKLYYYNSALANASYQKALDLRAAAVNPNDAEAFNKIGDAYIEMGDAYNSTRNYKQALAYYQEAVSIDPNYATAYNNLGKTYYELEDYAKAIINYQKALSINPNDVDAYIQMGSAYYMRKDYAKATKCYQEAVSIDSRNATAYNRMGLAYYEIGYYNQEAINCYQKALSINPEYAAAYYNMGAAYSRQGKWKKQINCYKKAARLGHEEAQKKLKETGRGW